MTATPAQLPLALSHPPQYGRDSFLAAPSNQAALSLVERWPEWPAPVVVLSGPPGSGKTHLAHIWAERAGAGLINASEIEAEAARILAGRSGIAVDDMPAEHVAEQGLFHLINAAAECGAALLLISRAPASAWSVGLPDLRSRLRLAAEIALQPADDELLRQVLVKLFADRQLMVEKTVLDYLLLRCERSLAAASRLVEALDREALAAGRRITRPMCARVLELLA